jgi:poly-gamma-glutamate system protein
VKKLYWRPQRASLQVLWIVAFVAVAGLALTERFPVQQEQPYYKQKIKAARLALRGFEAVKRERLARSIPLDAESDPTASGLIGEALTPVTTNPGRLPSKQSSVNPNFAAVIVQLLKRVDVGKGDVVAVGLSGSYPAINISALAALATLDARPIVISSVGSSQWGANNPDFLWSDMEELLHKRHVFTFRSAALSRGGLEDRALWLSKEGRGLLDAAIERSGLPKIEERTYAESVARRLEIYQQQAGGAKIKAYVNVGGGAASVGQRLGRRLFKPGITRTPPSGSADLDSVMARFVTVNVPVIHLINIDKLAQRYGLPQQPKEMPAVGQGKIFILPAPNRWMALGALVLTVGLLIAFVRLDWGYRIFLAGAREKPSVRPEKMV